MDTEFDVVLLSLGRQYIVAHFRKLENYRKERNETHISTPGLCLGNEVGLETEIHHLQRSRLVRLYVLLMLILNNIKNTLH